MSYYCEKCGHNHKTDSKIGIKHFEPDTSSFEEDRHYGTRTGHYEQPDGMVTPELPPKGEGTTGKAKVLSGAKGAVLENATPGIEAAETVSIEDYLMSLTDALRVHETDIEEMKKSLGRLEAAFAPIDEALQEGLSKAQSAKARQREGGMSIPISGDMGGRVMSFLETAISKWGGGGGGDENLGASKEAVDEIAYEIARAKKIQNDTMQAWGDKLRAARSVDFEEAP